MSESSQESAKHLEFLKTYVKFQAGRSEDENFIGFHGSDGECGFFVDKEGNVTDTTNTLGKDDPDESIINELAGRIYAERFPDKVKPKE